MRPDQLDPGPASDPRPTPRLLPPRLRAVADLVPAGAAIVDVGAGAGQLSLWLLGSGRVPAVIAVEREGAVGRELARRARPRGLSVRSGDGLRALRGSDRAETLVISGLGARSMLRVLDTGGERTRLLRRLVLQPQTEAGLLRSRLVKRGFAIVNERMALERGRFYTVIAAERRPATGPPAHPTLSEDDLLQAGPCLVRSGSPVVRAYWIQVQQRTGRLVDRAGPGRAHERTVGQWALATRVLAALDEQRACGEA